MGRCSGDAAPGERMRLPETAFSRCVPRRRGLPLLTAVTGWDER